MNEFGPYGKANKQFQTTINRIVKKFGLWPTPLSNNNLKMALEEAYIAGQENERARHSKETI